MRAFNAARIGRPAHIPLALPVSQSLHAALKVSRVVIKVVRAIVARGFAYVVKIIRLGRIKCGL